MTARLDFSTPHVLRDEEEYEAAREKVIALLDQDPAPDSAAGELLEFLTVLIAAYDDAHSTIGREAATPQEVVDFALAQRGEARAALHQLLGGKSRVSEFFGGKRALSLTQVQALRRHFALPADVLIPPVAGEEAPPPARRSAPAPGSVVQLADYRPARPSKSQEGKTQGVTRGSIADPTGNAAASGRVHGVAAARKAGGTVKVARTGTRGITKQSAARKGTASKSSRKQGR